MNTLLLVTPDKASFEEFASILERHDDVELSWAESGKRALDMISEAPFDLVVADEKLGDMTGIEFIETLVSVNPMINSAAVSSLPGDQFHEVSEGLGILLQLPVQPGAKDAEDLLNRVRHLKDLLQPKT